MGHLLGLNAWALIGLSGIESLGPTEELDLRIRPKKEFGPNLVNWANDEPCIILGFFDQELGLGLGLIMDKGKWPFTLRLGH